jgi:GNAT superfamily N-acetyltransferase
VSGIDVRPVTLDRWDDLEALFGERGAQAGCWCMWWRQSSADFRRHAGEGNRRALRTLVREGREPGLLAYRDGRPAGWCLVAPREELVRVRRSPTLRPTDDRPAWAIGCFYVDRRHRRAGVSEALLEAGIERCRELGGKLVEGYPVPDEVVQRDRAEAFTGTVSMFERAGFRPDPDRGGSRRRAMRLELGAATRPCEP